MSDNGFDNNARKTTGRKWSITTDENGDLHYVEKKTANKPDDNLTIHFDVYTDGEQNDRSDQVCYNQAY